MFQPEVIARSLLQLLLQDFERRVKGFDLGIQRLDACVEVGEFGESGVVVIARLVCLFVQTLKSSGECSGGAFLAPLDILHPVSEEHGSNGRANLSLVELQIALEREKRYPARRIAKVVVR